jgi:L-lactate dehydrogenase (cytochrome)
MTFDIVLMNSRAQPSILVLLELHRICPEVFDQLHIYIDGGFERGSDILKAISLGATAVGVGRPYLYSLTYGEEGVEHLSQGQSFYIETVGQERISLTIQ